MHLPHIAQISGHLKRTVGNPSHCCYVYLFLDILSRAVAKYSGRNWRLISECLSDYGRTDVQCLHRWQKVLRPGLKKGPWTEEVACSLNVKLIVLL